MKKEHKFAGISMNTATIGERYDLFACVDALPRFGCGAISLSREDLKRVGLANARKCLDDSGLVVTTLSRIGPLTGENSSAQRLALDEAKRAIEEAAAIRAQCLVVIAGGTPSNGQSLHACRQYVVEQLRELICIAEASGVQLSLEPLHPFFAASRGCFNTVRDAIDALVALDGRLGITIDTFHTWWDPRACLDIAALQAGQIQAFQVADWLSSTTDPFRDRGMPGEGVICFDELIEAVIAGGYCGFVDVEIISDRWSHMPLETVVSSSVKAVSTIIPSLSLPLW